MLVSIENTVKSLFMRFHLPTQTHKRSQEKMPFRDKNQTVQINRNMQAGMLLHRIRACNKFFFSTDISVSLVEEVLC